MPNLTEKETAYQRLEQELPLLSKRLDALEEQFKNLTYHDADSFSKRLNYLQEQLNSQVVDGVRDYIIQVSSPHFEETRGKPAQLVELRKCQEYLERELETLEDQIKRLESELKERK